MVALLHFVPISLRHLPHHELLQRQAAELTLGDGLEDGEHAIRPVADVGPQVGRSAVRHVDKPGRVAQPDDLIGPRGCFEIGGGGANIPDTHGAIDILGLPPRLHTLQLVHRVQELGVAREERRLRPLAHGKLGAVDVHVGKPRVRLSVHRALVRDVHAHIFKVAEERTEPRVGGVGRQHGAPRRLLGARLAYRRFGRRCVVHAQWKLHSRFPFVHNKTYQPLRV